METAARRRTRWSWLGRLAYGPALALQHAVRDGIRPRGREGEPALGDEHLLLLEHDPVFTLGRNASAQDVLAPPEWLASNFISVPKRMPVRFRAAARMG